MVKKELNQTNTESTKPNILFAVLAAIGMSLIGCVLYGVLYYVGYIAWIVPYIAILAAAWGYKKYNKKMDWKGYLIIAVIVIIGLLITMFLALTLYVAKEFNCSFGVALKDLFMLIDTHNTIRNYVVRDGVLTAVFTLLGLLSYYFYELRLKKLSEKPATDATTSKTEQHDENKAQETNTTEATKTTKTTKAKTTAEAEKVETEKTEVSAPVEEKLTAVPADLKDKPAKKTTQKKTQTSSTNKPLVVKPVVSNKTKTTKKDDKKGE